jgi:dTDP-glucose 4,6-dehydratase
VKVLVTGVAGFVGSHVAQQLLGDGYDVVGVGSLHHNGESWRIAAILRNEHASSDFTWVRHDLAAPFSNFQVTRQLRGHGIEAIVNVASLASVDVSIQDPVGFVQNNVNSTLNVLELARQLDVRRFIHVSTDEVYGTRVPCDDGHHMPSSPYSASKAAQEDICNAWYETFHVPVSIVRSANMFGERQSELAFIPRVIRAIVEDRIIPIHVDAAGKPGVRNYSYVGNVARYLTDYATAPSTRVHGNVTLRGQMTLDNFSLALNVAAILDRDLKYEFVDAATVRPGYDEKYELHGHDWEPKIGAGEALRRTVIHTAQRMGLDVE